MSSTSKGSLGTPGLSTPGTPVDTSDGACAKRFADAIVEVAARHNVLIPPSKTGPGNERALVLDLVDRLIMQGQQSATDLRIELRAIRTTLSKIDFATATVAGIKGTIGHVLKPDATCPVCSDLLKNHGVSSLVVCPKDIPRPEPMYGVQDVKAT